MVFILVFAFNLSSHTFAFWPGDSWWLRSVYWLVYLSLALCSIFGVYFMLEKLSASISNHWLFVIAVFVSWLPFGLAISMVDIATSRPATSYAIRELQSTGFLPTLLPAIAINILPRHLIFGLLVYFIHFYVRIDINSEEKADLGSLNTQSLSNTILRAAFLGKLSNKVRAEPKVLQAQEHYLNVTTALGQELILYKFGQALRELPKDYGLQIHRSFWVANDNIRGWSQADNNLKVILQYGGQAPVSRRFELYIKQQFSEVVDDV